MNDPELVIGCLIIYFLGMLQGYLFGKNANRK